jgi:hypothetical protein
VAARRVIAGEPGTAWVNTTSRVAYQFRCSFQNSCARCIQYAGQISDVYWPVPLHRGCQCEVLLVLPGHAAHPFVDYAAEVARLGPVERRRVMGKSSYALVQSGAVEWTDVVTPTRIRPFAEVVERAGLTERDLTRAGVVPRQARQAHEAIRARATVVPSPSAKPKPTPVPVAAVPPAEPPTAGLIRAEIEAAHATLGRPQGSPTARALVNTAGLDPTDPPHHAAGIFVTAWEELPAAHRAALEPHMIRAGLEKVGEPGREVTFTGRLMKGAGAIKGDLVRVDDPGWVLPARGDEGEFLLRKADVTLIAEGGESPPPPPPRRPPGAESAAVDDFLSELDRR